MSDTFHSLAHAWWHGKYPIVLVPKRRRKTLDGHLRKALGILCHALARQQACRSMAGHVMPGSVPRMGDGIHRNKNA